MYSPLTGKPTEFIKSLLLDDNPFCSWDALPTVEVYPTSSSYALFCGIPNSDEPPTVLNNFGVLSALLPGIFVKSILEKVPSSLSSTCSCLIISEYLF